LLGKNLKTKNETITTVAVQRRGKHGPVTMEILVETVLCNPLLGNCNSSATTMGKKVFLCGPCPGVILKTNGVIQSIPRGRGFEYLHRSSACRRKIDQETEKRRGPTRAVEPFKKKKI
jgi:hypothetical protein